MRRLVGAANPVVRRMLTSGFAGPMSPALLVLRYRGRKSGRTFTTPVGYVRDGDRVVMVTSPSYGWWPNMVGGADVEVRLPEGWRRGRAEDLLPDDARYDETVAIQVAKRGPGMLRGFGFDIDDAGRMAPEAKATATQHAHIVLVTLAAVGARCPRAARLQGTLPSGPPEPPAAARPGRRCGDPRRGAAPARRARIPEHVNCRNRGGGRRGPPSSVPTLPLEGGPRGGRNPAHQRRTWASPALGSTTGAARVAHHGERRLGHPRRDGGPRVAARRATPRP